MIAFELCRRSEHFLSRDNTNPEIITVVARTSIRIFKAERLEYDDYWIYLAYLILCVNASLQTVQTPYIYHMVRVRAGLEPAGEGFLEDGNAYLRYEFAIVGLFWSVLWSVSAHFGVNSPGSYLFVRATRHASRAVRGFKSQTCYITCLLCLQEAMLTPKWAGESELLGFLLEAI